MESQIHQIKYLDKDLLDPAKPIGLVRELNNNLSIRTGKYGDYIFYKKPRAKKPEFYKLNRLCRFLEIINENLDIYQVKNEDNIFKFYIDNKIELIADYFTKENFISKYGEQKCKIVSSISMFYDLPDPVQFARDIYDILDDDGIWTCEQSYVLTMLEQNSFDTICHEHLEYYGLHQIKKIAEMSNFKIIDVKFNDCNGCSFRIYFCKDKSKKKYRQQRSNRINFKKGNRLWTK